MIRYYEKINNKTIITPSSVFKIKDLDSIINVLNKKSINLKHLSGFCLSVNPLIVIKRNL